MYLGKATIQQLYYVNRYFLTVYFDEALESQLIDNAIANIKAMHGEYRMPTILKQVDSETRIV